MVKINVIIAAVMLGLIGVFGNMSVSAKKLLRCPEDFDPQHPYDEVKEKEYFELIKKRSAKDPVVKKLLGMAKVKGFDNPQSSELSDEDNGSVINIPVVFHVIKQYSSHEPVPLAAIKANIASMNKGFAGQDGKGGFADSKIRFTLQAVQVIENSSWFSGCARYRTYSAMQEATAFGTARYLNVWLCRPSGLLGFAFFPDEYEDDYHHGVVLNYQSLPAVPGYEPDPDYNEGDTLTHEVGHYLGLYHTFQGGCRDRDQISDTPAEASPARGKVCLNAKPRDTCRKAPGVDPVTNYMDYSDDLCLDNFTPLQAARMRTLTFEYRPTLTQNQELQCVSGGNAGNVGSWKVCRSKCFFTSTPSSGNSPAKGWCYTDTEQTEWGDCCCLKNGCTPKDNIYDI